MQLTKSINLIIFYLLLAVFLVIVFSNYGSGDFFWTPLRSIYIFKTSNFWDFETFKSFLISTVHNDSVKLFPTLFEIISLKLSNNWEPRISLLLGLGSWLLNFYIYLKLILRSFKLTFKSQKVLALILFLCFFGPPYFFYRFTIVFAIFKTLPSLCVLFSAQILFKKDPTLNNIELILLCTFCLVAQYSYSWGSILWITTFLVLYCNYKEFKGKYLHPIKLITFSFVGTISTILYILILDFSTLTSLFIKNNISLNFKDFSNSIKGFYSFLSTYSLSYMGGLDSYSQKFPTCLFNTDIINVPECGINKSYIRVSLIIFSLFIFLMLIQIVKIIQKQSTKTFIYKSSPFIFIASNTSAIPIANIFLRAQYTSPPRYFPESTLFSISIILIALLTLRINKFNLLKLFIFLLIFLSSFINFSNINIYTFKLLNKDPLGDPQFSNMIICIRSAPENKKNFNYLFNQCNFWKTNKYFNDQSKIDHPFIKIKNFDFYANKVFKVLGK